MRYFWLSLQRTFEFSGRAQRAEYWYFLLFSTILYLVTLAVPILGLLFLVLLITQISLSVRRLHDINMSGWWGLLFIPLGLPMLIVGFIDSAPDNQYGVNPKGNTEPSSAATTQQKSSPELKDFHYTPEHKPKSDAGSEHKSSSSRPAAARLPLKDFN
jgi:uncharacterized membrane protein YhaH (DUF805 family)